MANLVGKQTIFSHAVYTQFLVRFMVKHYLRVYIKEVYKNVLSPYFYPNFTKIMQKALITTENNNNHYFSRQIMVQTNVEITESRRTMKVNLTIWNRTFFKGKS